MHLHLSPIKPKRESIIINSSDVIKLISVKLINIYLAIIIKSLGRVQDRQTLRAHAHIGQ